MVWLGFKEGGLVNHQDWRCLAEYQGRECWCVQVKLGQNYWCHFGASFGIGERVGRGLVLSVGFLLSGSKFNL